MQQLSTAELALLDSVDAAPMLDQVQRWSAINSGTGNLVGLAEQAAQLADAFAALPGEIALEARSCQSPLRPMGANLQSIMATIWCCGCVLMPRAAFC